MKPKKMNPEIWMPFYGQDFDRSTKGWPRAMRWSYLAAIWAYWCGKCEGLIDNEEILRNICECEPHLWAATRGMIFGPKFKLQEGAWHQDRAREERIKAVDIMEAMTKRAKAGADARWHAQADAQALPKHVPKQSLMYAPSPSPSPSDTQSPTPSSSPLGGCTAPTSKPEPVSAESICEALQASPAYAGIDVSREYMKMAAWCEANHKQPTKRRFINWLNRIEPMTTTTTPAKPQPKSVWELSKVLEAKQKLADELLARHAVQGPLDTSWDDRRNQDQYKALRVDIRDLSKKMAAMA